MNVAGRRLVCLIWALIREVGAMIDALSQSGSAGCAGDLGPHRRLQIRVTECHYSGTRTEEDASACAAASSIESGRRRHRDGCAGALEVGVESGVAGGLVPIDVEFAGHGGQQLGQLHGVPGAAPAPRVLEASARAPSMTGHIIRCELQFDSEGLPPE